MIIKMIMMELKMRKYYAVVPKKGTGTIIDVVENKFPKILAEQPLYTTTMSIKDATKFQKSHPDYIFLLLKSDKDVAEYLESKGVKYDFYS